MWCVVYDFVGEDFGCVWLFGVDVYFVVDVGV